MSTAETPVEDVDCPVCRSEDRQLALVLKDRFHLDTSVAYTLVRCKGCGHEYLNPRPIERISARFYADESYCPFVSSHESRTFLDWSYAVLRAWNLRWKRRYVERQHPGRGNVLDFGCGTGEFLAELKSHGWTEYGIERDIGAAAFARDTLALNVTCGTLRELAPRAGPFDVITLWHVLEHTYDPHAVIERLAESLAPGGCLILAVPNAAGLDAARYEASWVAYDVPRHVQHFTPRSLLALCREHGLRLKDLSQLPLDTCFNVLLSEKLRGALKPSASDVLTRPFRMVVTVALTLLRGAGSRAPDSYRGSTILTCWVREKD